MLGMALLVVLWRYEQASKSSSKMEATYQSRPLATGEVLEQIPRVVGATPIYKVKVMLGLRDELTCLIMELAVVAITKRDMSISIMLAVEEEDMELQVPMG